MKDQALGADRLERGTVGGLPPDHWQLALVGGVVVDAQQVEVHVYICDVGLRRRVPLDNIEEVGNLARVAVAQPDRGGRDVWLAGLVLCVESAERLRHRRPRPVRQRLDHRVEGLADSQSGELFIQGGKKGAEGGDGDAARIKWREGLELA